MRQRRLAWAGALALSSAAAQAAPGTPRPPVDEAVRALEVAAGGAVRLRRSHATDLVSFLGGPDGGVIPVSRAAAAAPEARALAFARDYAAAFGLTSERDLAVTNVEALDAQGMDHVRLQQLHRGVPVTGAEMTIHLRGAGIVAVLAKTLPDLGEIDVVPRLGADVAERTALEAVAQATGRSHGAAHTVRLEVFNRGLLEGAIGVTRLAWFVEVRAEGLREYVWVDARRGVVLLRFSQMAEARNRRVHNAKNGPDLPGLLIRREGQPPNGDVDVDAAFDHSGDAYDYFASQHGRDSFDGRGAAIVSTVRFCPGAPCPYPNAAWTGSQLVYGKGFPLADDVAVHEYTHALTEQTANLFYYMQSGALNESISDIFGETVDLTNGRGNDAPSARWQMGEDVPGLGAIRNMMDPIQFGDPGKLSDPLHCLLTDNGGVHTNSGVPNHAYALLVDGGTFNDRTVAGIGLIKAGQVVYRALSVYLTSASNFSDFDDALGQSCQDLRGGASGITAGDCDQVSAATQAVLLSEPFPCMDPSGPRDAPLACSSDQVAVSVFRDDLENLDSGNWTTAYTYGGNHWRGGAGSPDIYWTGFSTSGRWSFWGFGAPAVGDSWVETTVPIQTAVPSRLRFRHFFGFELQKDGGLVQYDLNDGYGWKDFDYFRGASPTIPLLPGNPLASHRAFTGQSWGYVTSEVGLPGRSTRVRFRIGTDAQGAEFGWLIDDIEVYTCVDKPRLRVGNVTVLEGDSGMTPAIFTVSLSKTFHLPVSVDYATASLGADAGVDYVESSGTLAFPPGITERQVTVPVLGDHVPEGSEWFALGLSRAVNALVPSPGRGIVTDDDGWGTAISDVVVAEPRAGTVAATFTVTARPPDETTITVDFATSDGSAAAPADYEATRGTLTFDLELLEQTVTVPVKASATSLSPRTFHVDLSSSSGPPIVRPRGTATIYEPGFYPVPPCRVLDTRTTANAPALSAGSTREVVVGGQCGIPVRASAVSLNVTVVAPTSGGDLRIFSSTAGLPLVSAINYAAGQTRANNAVISLSPEGRLKVFCEQAAGEVDVVLDVNGFFE